MSDGNLDDLSKFLMSAEAGDYIFRESESGSDMFIISRDVDEIVGRLELFCKNPQELYPLAERGRARFQEVFGFAAQMEPRFKIIEELL